jgi:hexosaminidase
MGDIADIVAYGRNRAIRVIPEVDMPGHAASWCKGYPTVRCACLLPPIAFSAMP